NQGWRAASTHLEVEHGGTGHVGRDYIIERFYQYCRQATLDGQPLLDHPEVRERLIDVYADEQINRLLGLRSYYLAHANRPRSYEGAQSTYIRKMSILRMAQAIHDVLGNHALTRDPEWGAAEGWLEYYMRHAIQQLHPGGTGDIQKVVMARRIGIGRAEREEAGTIA
ncbi:MAG TPA: acyl-CoA dehydrogenase family protein, partial [Dehalococcoidia bacterium]|nr:acyl-CoA dehydrogenase family protein [Dehalococcoidia bacterium]